MSRMRRPHRTVRLAVGGVAAVALVAVFGTVTVPDVIGDDTRTAFARLHAAGLSEPDIGGIGDTVVRVNPDVGTRVLRFSAVSVIFGEAADG